jgi:hypothetical protein
MAELLAGKKDAQVLPPEENSDSDLVTFSIRLPVVDRDLFRRFFKSRGMDLSNGLRSWIYDKAHELGLK